MSEKLKIGISIGDTNGIGVEVILKTLQESKILDYCTPIVYGNTKVVSFHRKSIRISDFNFNVINHPKNALARKANIINCWQEDVRIDFGQSNETGGKYAFISLQKACDDLLAGHIDALVTAPINKNNIQRDDFKFPGHTEYLQYRNKSIDALMFLISDNLRVGVVTGHIPIADVAKSINQEKIIKKLQLINESLKKDFWVDKPKIAVLGLNPHAGDNGLLGEEDEQVIKPAIKKAFDESIIALGPYPADGFFGNDIYKKFDAVLAMYHDQGLIPFKTLSFENGVNFTAGLNFVRTSPNHGTGYDIAGKNLANPTSFREALFSAIHIVKNRNEHQTMLANQLKTGGKVVETQFDVKDDAN